MAKPRFIVDETIGYASLDHQRSDFSNGIDEELLESWLYDLKNAT